MAVRTEVAVRLPNSPGALASAFDRLADARIAIEAWHMGGDAAFRLVCDNPLLAIDVLGGPQAASLRDVMTTVVATRDLPRFLRRLASLGANVEYAYTGAVEGPASVYLVVGVADAARTAIQLGI